MKNFAEKHLNIQGKVNGLGNFINTGELINPVFQVHHQLPVVNGNSRGIREILQHHQVILNKTLRGH